MKTELRVAVTIGGMRDAILFPEQLARHALLFQLFMDGDKVWWGAARDGAVVGLVSIWELRNDGDCYHIGIESFHPHRKIKSLCALPLCSLEFVIDGPHAITTLLESYLARIPLLINRL